MTAAHQRSAELFIPGAEWQQNAQAEVCSGRHCKKRFSVLLPKHHCRWCGQVFCDACAPRCCYRKETYRRCVRCQLPIIFRSYINPWTGKREAVPFECILSFLNPRSITALVQSCSTMQQEFPLPSYPFLPSISSRFPSFYEGAQIGRGGFGTVYKCEDRTRPPHSHVALKRVQKSSAYSYTFWSKIITELQILRSVQHPNIACLLEVFQTVEDLIIVMEAGDGGTAQRACEYVRRNRLPLEPLVASIVQQVACGLDYLFHEKHILHRDIKLENIVLSFDYSKAMIIDFGLAEYVVNAKSQTYASLGTAGCASPENIAAVLSGDHSFEADGETMHLGDIFSLGIAAYTMLTFRRPLRSKRFTRQYEEIQSGIRCDGPFWDGISVVAGGLVSAMLQLRPHQRPAYKAICAHPFITKNAPLFETIVNHRREVQLREEEQIRNEWDVMDTQCTGTDESTPLDTPEQFPLASCNNSSRPIPRWNALSRIGDWAGTIWRLRSTEGIDLLQGDYTTAS